MLHSQLPLRKQEHYEVWLKRFVYLFFGVVLLSIAACNNSNSQNAEPSTDSTKSTVNKPAVNASINNIDTKLYVLYLKNFKENPTDNVNNELERLFVKNTGADKIVFQLFQSDSGILSLAAFNGSKQMGRTDFVQDPIALSRSNALPEADYEMDGKNVFLGSWEISKKDKNDLSKLKGYINNPDKKYIVFTPQLTKIEGTNNYTIVYNVSFGTTIPQSTNNKAVFSGMTANPSPPRQAY